MTPQVWVAIVIGIAATVEDLTRRQVSNWICGAAFLAGIILHVISEGWRGGVSAMLGAVTGFGVFLIFYLLGGMGGGDVKLMAGFGAVLGVNAGSWRQLYGRRPVAVCLRLWRSRSARCAACSACGCTATTGRLLG